MQLLGVFFGSRVFFFPYRRIRDWHRRKKWKKSWREKAAQSAYLLISPFWKWPECSSSFWRFLSPLFLFLFYFLNINERFFSGNITARSLVPPCFTRNSLSPKYLHTSPHYPGLYRLEISWVWFVYRPFFLHYSGFYWRHLF